MVGAEAKNHTMVDIDTPRRVPIEEGLVTPGAGSAVGLTDIIRIKPCDQEMVRIRGLRVAYTPAVRK